MSTKFEVVSAFLDNASFDLEELADALNEPAGRTLLIDSLSLRRLVQPTEPIPPLPTEIQPRRASWRIALAAAALFVGLGGGYLLGVGQPASNEVAAPPPTRVIQAIPFTPEGGTR